MPILKHRGAVIHYEVHGTTGPALLLIQGVGVSGAGWRPQVEGLAGTHRLLSFDNRGIGRSRLDRGAPLTIRQMADDARALMDEVGWDRCHVVGHSMGGAIAQRLALDFPGRIRSVALLCTMARGKDVVRLTPWVFWRGIRMNLGSKAARRRAFLSMVYSPDFLAAADDGVLAARTSELFGHDLAVQPPVTLRQALALRRHDARRELHRLAGQPTLVLSARHDQLTPPRLGRQLAALIPGARFVELAEAAHGATIQCAPEVNRLLGELVASVRPD